MTDHLTRFAREAISDPDVSEALELIEFDFPRDDQTGEIERDGYNDPLPPTETTTDVRGSISRPSEAAVRQNIDGADASTDLVVHVSSEHTPITTLASVGDGPAKAAELVRANGDVLRVIDAHDEANGLLRLETTVASRGPGGSL